MNNNIKKLGKCAASVMLAAVMMTGMAFAPTDSGSGSGTSVISAEAATATVYDLNSTPTYSALTKSKVTAIYKAAFSDTGTYISGKPATYYTNGRQPALNGGGYAGVLTADTLKAAGAAMNAYRTLAGLNEIPVSSGSTYQAGAFIRSTSGNFKHKLDLSTVSKPAGVSAALLNSGVNCPNNVLSYGSTPTACFINWMSEKNNGAGALNTGHRMFVLDPSLKSVSFGYSDKVALGSGVWNSSYLMKEAVSAYPSPGYMPTQMVDYAPAPWVAQLNSVYVYYSDESSVKVTVTAPDSKAYTCTKANGKLRFDKRSVYYLEFDRPEITASCYTGTYKVEISGLKSFSSGGAATVRYTVNFYDPLTDTSEDTGKQTESKPAKADTTTSKPSGSTGSTGSASVTTAKTDLLSCKIRLDKATFAYTGKAIKPVVSVRYNAKDLKEGRDYTLSYLGNVSAGTARVTVIGKGSYAGTKTLTYKIVKEFNSSSLTVKGISLSYRYTGSRITPAPKVYYYGKLLVKGRDYTLTYCGNRERGTAKVYIRGMGEYTGQLCRSYSIV